MKQSRRMSLAETVTSTAVGFLVSWSAGIAIFPAFGLHPSLAENAGITAVYTVLSIGRGYVLRRVFERLRRVGAA